VPELHSGHKELIDAVVAKHKRVIIFLGVTPTLGTKANPLDFTSRIGLLDDYIKKLDTRLVIHPLPDVPGNDIIWSQNLDKIVRSIIPMGSVCLYGGRDSFIKHYTGSYDTYELDIIGNAEGTQVRKEYGQTLINSKDFRAGQIYQSQNKFPTVYPTVDVAVVKQDSMDGTYWVLLGGKPNHDKLQFPGGFADPTDDGYEEAGLREVVEELDVEIDTKLEYIGSYRINDARYTGEEKIITTFYLASYIFGSGNAKDDLSGSIWVPIAEHSLIRIADSHKVLFQALLNHKDWRGKKNAKKSIALDR
jgi:bifunctional NMN adenylyltransferase/nudix hydrolase